MLILKSPRLAAILVGTSTTGLRKSANNDDPEYTGQFRSFQKRRFGIPRHRGGRWQQKYHENLHARVQEGGEQQVELVLS